MSTMNDLNSKINRSLEKFTPTVSRTNVKTNQTREKAFEVFMGEALKTTNPPEVNNKKRATFQPTKTPIANWWEM